MDSVRPPSPFQHSAGELVDNADIPVDEDVVLVPVVELLSPERSVQLVDEVRGNLVVKVVDTQCPLHGVYSLLGGSDDPLLLVDVVMDVAPQATYHLGETLVELHGVA